MSVAHPIGLKARTAVPPQEPAAVADERVLDRSIGDFIRQVRGLSEAQVEEILGHQRLHGIRFGEAAVALQLATRDDVLWALSQQFHYPYAPGDGASFNSELIAAVDPFHRQTESFRDIRSQLMLGALAPEQPRRALAVMSPNIGDGKSFFAANLAVVFSQLGARTLLIDADMRTPRQHALFGVPNDYGLSSILSGRSDTKAIHSLQDLPSLFVLPVGTLPPNPLELLQRPAFGLLVNELLGKFDHVIVDTPSSTHGADCRVLAAKCGVAMIIGRRGKSRMKALQGLVSEVTRGPAKFAGVVINDH
ncbi:MAG: polysaccharide biosynthesis tyrosine autokinase [Rhizobacter sp.]|nr:polysaccharide biosynthesis tyrosine autokinase [Rhizobacter sp.]MBP6270163.1 polysaccharide biosynthesis tyrosine autokinase [Rhizobacter sp.]